MTDITVVVTTYNLIRCIDKVFLDLSNQSYTQFDILFVDDCSTDGTRNLIEDFQKKAPERIKAIFADRNSGSPAISRNRALNSGLITGDYVVFLDGDDRIEPTFLEKLKGAIEREGADIAVCAYDRIEASTNSSLGKEMLNMPRTVNFPTEYDKVPFINTSLWNKLIRVSCIEDIRLPNFKVGEDLCFLLAIYKNVHSVAFVNEILIHYYVYNHSVIAKTDIDTVYSFAENLVQVRSTSTDIRYTHAIQLIAFLHIGLSMLLRISANKDASKRNFLRWQRKYFSVNFQNFKGNKQMSYRVLSTGGFKGIAIWVCKMLYLVGCLRLYLIGYNFLRRLCRVEFKF